MNLISKVIVLLFVGLSLTRAFGLVHQRLDVVLDPGNHSIKVFAEIWLGDGASGEVKLELNSNLKISNSTCNELIELAPSQYLCKTLPGTPVILEYSGELRSIGQEGIGQDGVALFPSMAWHPIIEGEFYTFEMKVTLPEGWKSLSQDDLSNGSGHEEIWRSGKPQEGIYLMANKWFLYENDEGNYISRVYLLKDEAGLATSLLHHTKQYISHYEQLIGPYPYKQMATVENFWETGYGMASFTLLGSQVIRLPFLAYSSFPHEILHNWWGNGVYVDWSKGNWSEGLTSYLADHWLQESRGKGAEYRRTALLNYSVFAAEGKDFPLKDFVSRYDRSSMAVGYSKSMMVFHMLKNLLGEDVFYEGLRHFFLVNKFNEASFHSLKESFEIVSGKPLEKYFEQWVNFAGAPKIEIFGILQASNPNNKFQLGLSLDQSQASPTYQISIPVKVLFSDGSSKVVQLEMVGGRSYGQWNFDKKVVQLHVDPEFDVFRYLYDEEIPPSVSSHMGASGKTIVVLPEASANLLAWKKWITKIQSHYASELVVVSDGALQESQLQGNNVWVLGKENLFWSLLRSKGVSDLVERKGDQVVLKKSGEMFDLNKKTVFSVFKSVTGRDNTVAFLSAPSERIILRSADKIPHYGKYSFLAFEDEKNLLKIQWEATESPLIYRLEP